MKAAPPVVRFDAREASRSFSARGALRGKHIFLIGGTGFIGKVWLANLLTDVPDIGRISLGIRGTRSASALDRFQRLVETSPVFEQLAERHGENFAESSCASAWK